METKRNSNINKTILEKGVAAEKRVAQLSQLLWDAYLVLDSGTQEERLAMLEKLEHHFQKKWQTETTLNRAQRQRPTTYSRCELSRGL